MKSDQEQSLKMTISRKNSANSEQIKKFILLLFILVKLYHAQEVVWANWDKINTGQITAYDDSSITTQAQDEIQIQHNIIVTLKIEMSSNSLMQGVSFSGLESYTSEKMQFNVLCTGSKSTSLSVRLIMYPCTFMHKFMINYIVTEQSSLMIKRECKYLIIYKAFGAALQDWKNSSEQTGLKTLKSQDPITISPKIFMSTISGLRMTNDDIKQSYLHLQSRLIQDADAPQNKIIIEFTIQINQNSVLEELSITTILSTESSQTFGYSTLIQHFSQTVTQTQGLDHLNLIEKSGVLDELGTLYFGIRGFKFNLGEVRLFLLDHNNREDNRIAMEISISTETVTLDFLLIADKSCVNNVNGYWVGHYQCIEKNDCKGIFKEQTSTNADYCLDCDATCNECLQTTVKCKQCFVGQNRKQQIAGNSSCECDYENGFVDSGTPVCKPCSYHLLGCKICSNTEVCEVCHQVFEHIDNKTCKCPDNMYTVTGVCLSYPGCLKANSIITGEYCEECDLESNFQHDTTTTNYSCVCKNGYTYNNNSGRCQDICGDQIAAKGKCDDGNIYGGDGCSSVCDVENQYMCTEKKPGEISECVQQKQIVIIFRYAQKVLGQNQAILALQIEPAHPFLRQNTFNNAITTDFSNASMSVRYDPSTSFIYMTIDYSQALQNGQYQIDIKFDNLDIKSENINLQVTLTGVNAMLNYSESYSINSIIEIVSIVLASVSFILAVLASILNEKLTGIELAFPVQAAFFAMGTLPLANSPSALAALWPLTFSTGFNMVKTYDLSSNYKINSNSIRMHLSGQFILNFNIGFCIIMFIVIIFTMVFGVVICLQKKQRKLDQRIKFLEECEKQKQQKKLQKAQRDKAQQGKIRIRRIDEQLSQIETNQEAVQLEKTVNELDDTRQNTQNWRNIFKMILDRFFTIFVLLNFMPICYDFLQQSSELGISSESVWSIVNAVYALLVVITMVISLYWIIYDYKSDKIIGFNCQKGKYAIIYISIFFAYILLTSSLQKTRFSAYLALAFSILPIILIVYQRPYQNSLKLQTFIAIICQLSFSVFAMVSIFAEFSSQNDNQSDEIIAVFQAFAVLGFIGLANTLTIVRLVYSINLQNLQFFDFTEGQVDEGKSKKKKVFLIDAAEKRNQNQESDEDSVRQIFVKKKKKQLLMKESGASSELKQKEDLKKTNEINQAKKNQPVNQNEDDDVDQLDLLKQKLRKQLQKKKLTGQILS